MRLKKIEPGKYLADDGTRVERNVQERGARSTGASWNDWPWRMIRPDGRLSYCTTLSEARDELRAKGE